MSASAESARTTDRDAARAARRAERLAAKQQADAEKRRRREEADARRAAEHRERQAVAERAYGQYRRVREWARRTPDVSPEARTSLSEVERGMVAGLAHLWDASPDVIANLRRYCEPITGVRIADYEGGAGDLALQLKYKVGFLRRHIGAEFFVQESPLLGGFGAEWHRQLYNEDTLRFFKGIAALYDGGVLEDCRHDSPRRFVWEIGGGWGGFAGQFKTICPNVTYLITGIPELLLVSATYLMTAFPDAQCRFYEPSAGADLWQDWDQVDFIFAPESAVAHMQPPVDVALDVMALRRMSDSRVSLHVQRAFDLGARYFFSQLPGTCFPLDVPKTWSAIARFYWPHLIPPRIEASAFVTEDEQAVPLIDDYAHLVGWRRIRV